VKERMEELRATVEPLQKEIAQLKSEIEENQKELRARELSLERTTVANEGLSREISRLNSELQGMPILLIATLLVCLIQEY